MLAAHVIARLIEHPDRHFCDRKVWNAHLDALGITALKVDRIKRVAPMVQRC